MRPKWPLLTLDTGASPLKAEGTGVRAERRDQDRVLSLLWGVLGTWRVNNVALREDEEENDCFWT